MVNLPVNVRKTVTKGVPTNKPKIPNSLRKKVENAKRRLNKQIEKQNLIIYHLKMKIIEEKGHLYDANKSQNAINKSYQKGGKITRDSERGRGISIEDQNLHRHSIKFYNQKLSEAQKSLNDLKARLKKI